MLIFMFSVALPLTSRANETANIVRAFTQMSHYKILDFWQGRVTILAKGQKDKLLLRKIILILILFE